MSVTLKDIKDKYQDYIDLNYVKSRQDPDEEPFKTKYVARKLIQAVLAELENQSEFLNSSEKQAHDEVYTKFFEKLDSKVTKPRVFLIVKMLEYYLGRNFVETEEVESGERLVSKVVRDLDEFDSGFEYNPLTVHLKLSCLNELIYIWSSRADYKRCLTLIQSVEEIYNAFKIG